MGRLNALFRVLPGPVIFWASTWLDLFASTLLLDPETATEAQITAVALGAICAVVISFVLADARPVVIRWLAVTSLVFMILAFIECLRLGAEVRSLADPVLARGLRDDWFYFSVAGMTLVVVTLAMGGLLVPKRKLWIWLVGGVAVLILAGLALFFFFRRTH